MILQHRYFRKSHLIVSILAVAFLSAAGRGHAKGFTLVKKGQPKATVVVPAQGNEKAKTAAAELQSYVEKISGAKLLIVPDTAQVEGPVVLVGSSKYTDSTLLKIPSGLTAARREEGYLIDSRDNRLVLAGNDAGPYHGTEYAVYDFLKRLGVRWFMPGDFGEMVPKKDNITFPEIEIKEKPDFIMRNWWLHAKPDLAEQERLWKLRNRMNPDLMFMTPGDSSARNIIPEAQYFKEHPEYFAMNPDGSRNPYLPNLTNTKSVEIAAGIIKDYFRKHPEANSYGFAPDDGLPRDYNPETVKLNQGFTDLLGRPGVPAEVSATEEWLNFANQVTAEVRTEFPDVYIATNGYANRNMPPQGMKLNDHLIVMFAAIWSCTIHAYDDPHCWQKTRQGLMLKRWSDLCNNVWVYGYQYQMLASALTLLPETRKIRRDLPLMKKWGVIGFLDETRNVWAECGIPSRYLRAQLEWKTDADADAILKEFYSQWYGDAAGAMRDYYDALEDVIESTPMHGHEDRILPEVYTPKLMAQLEKSLAAAEKAADTDATRLHVRAERLIYDHLKAYVAMSAADFNNDWVEAAKQAGQMLDARKQLNAICPFFIQPDESGYHTGVWYWTVTDRQKFYLSQMDKTTGKTGDLIAVAQDPAMLRLDPHDEGVATEWFDQKTEGSDWKPVTTTRPFYCQGYEDAQGYTQPGVIWYRLKVDVPASAKGKKIMLCAPTVNPEGWCWVNGQYVGHRNYREAYERPIPMEVDVTNAILPGRTNTIAFRINLTYAVAWAPEGLLSRVFLWSPKES